MGRRQVVQNFIRIGADGKVSAQFPGGVLLNRVHNPDEHAAVVPESGVMWQNTNGALVAQVYGSDASPSRNSQSALQLQAISPLLRFVNLFLSSDDTTVLNQEIGFTFPGLSPNPSFGGTVMRGDGASSFLRLAGGVGKYSFYFGLIDSAGNFSQGNTPPGGQLASVGRDPGIAAPGRYLWNFQASGAMFLAAGFALNAGTTITCQCYAANVTQAYMLANNSTSGAPIDTSMFYIFIRDT